MRRSAVLASLLPLLLLPLAAAAQGTSIPGADEFREDGEERIAAIRIEGERRADEAAILGAMASRPGGPLDPDLVARDIRQVFALGLFSEIRVDAEDTARGPVLVVTVTEKPAIREVRITGNDEISTEDLTGELDVRAAQILDRAAVRRNAEKLTRQYVEKGYYLAEVDHRIEPREGNEVDVVFVVREHAKVEVRSIRFVGNEHISDDQLKEGLITQEGNFLSFLTGAGTFREDAFERDLLVAQGVYYDHGYINVRFGKPVTALSADKRYLDITIPVEEGEQFSLGAIDFSGDLIVSKEELFERLSVKEGEIFSRAKLGRDIQGITELYGDAAYAFANVTPLTAVHPENRTVDLTFDIQKGPKVRWERIEIVGNEKTRDKVIRRELRVYEGEWYHGGRRRLSQARVNALGFFETVEFTTRRGSRDDLIVGVVEVKERPTGTFQVGAGFSSVESFIATAQISQNNFLGWGQSASLQAQLSSLRQLVQLQFVEPYLFDTNWTFSFNFYNTEIDYLTFDRMATGGDITFGHPLPVGFTEELRLFLTYTLEDVEVDRTGGRRGGSQPLEHLFRDGLTSSLRLTLNWDTRNNRLFPSKGFVQSASVERAAPALGSDFNYTRYQGISRWYFELPWRFVFKVNATVGFIDGEDLPISELYYLGGINSVRGYSLRSIAPERPVPTDSSDPQAPTGSWTVGGNKQLVLNNELEFPIAEQVGIRGVVFYDLGNVFAEDQSFFDEPNYDLPLDLFHSVGFGFRWFSPIGPLRFEWGIPLTPREGDESILFEFTIGNSF